MRKRNGQSHLTNLTTNLKTKSTINLVTNMTTSMSTMPGWLVRLAVRR